MTELLKLDELLELAEKYNSAKINNTFAPCNPDFLIQNMFLHLTNLSRQIEGLKQDRERLNFILTKANIDVDFNGIWFSVLMYKGKPIVFDGKDPLIVIDNAMAFWRSKNGTT